MRSRITALASLTALLLAAPALSHAQATCTAEGFVLDKEGNPIPDVAVLLSYKGHMPQKYRTKTNEMGKFVHVRVWEGNYDITFSKEGVGEVTVEDFLIREIPSLEKAPTFRLGGPQAPPPPPEAEAAQTPAPKGPTAAESAATLAARLEGGNALLAEGKLDEAVAAYEEVAAQAPDLPEVHHNLGLAYKKRGDLEKAEASFQKAGELDPDFAEPHGALSLMLANDGRRDEALVEAEMAVELAPDNAQYLYNLAVLYKDSGRSQEAEQAFLELEEIDPHNPEIHFHLGTTLLGLGKVPEAIDRLETYVKTAPADAPNVASARSMIEALKKQQ